MHSLNSQLPPELIDHIIDKLSDDVTSLKACTTVCRAWISRSRFHLFSTFRVGGPAEAFLTFLDFLQNVSAKYVATENGPSGLSMVRALALDGKGLAQKPLLTLGTLQAILRYLPGLRTLHLTALQLDDRDFVPAKPVPLVELAVVSVDAHCPTSAGSELLALLSLFSCIDSLLLRFVHFNHFPLTHGEARDHPLLTTRRSVFPGTLEVRDLRLHLPRHTVFFLELFRRIAPRKPPTSLRVTCRSTEKFEAIGAFCRDADIARSLERLEVDLKYCIPRKLACYYCT